MVSPAPNHEIYFAVRLVLPAVKPIIDAMEVQAVQLATTLPQQQSEQRQKPLKIADAEKLEGCAWLETIDPLVEKVGPLSGASSISGRPPFAIQPQPTHNHDTLMCISTSCLNFGYQAPPNLRR